MSRFPFGYTAPGGGGVDLTFDELEAKPTWNRLHPEFKRRLRRMMECAAAEGVRLGVGTGWRSYASQAEAYRRDPKTFAAPGNSNHEGFPGNGNGDKDAVAADMVPNTAWDWMERNCARFGLRTFRHVNNEPWHVQPVEIPASRQYRTTRWDLPVFPLPEVPGTPVAPAPKPAEPPAAQPAPQIPTPATPSSKEIVVQFKSEVMLRGSKGSRVKWLQSRLNAICGWKLAVDGVFGPKTEKAVKDFQAFFKLGVDGVAGPKTQAAVVEIGMAVGK